MDIVVGRHSFNSKTLKTVSKDKALQGFKNIDSKIVEEAWNIANPRGRKRVSKTNKA